MVEEAVKVFHWHMRYCSRHRRPEFFQSDIKDLPAGTKIIIHLPEVVRRWGKRKR